MKSLGPWIPSSEMVIENEARSRGMQITVADKKRSGGTIRGKARMKKMSSFEKMVHITMNIIRAKVQ